VEEEAVVVVVDMAAAVVDTAGAAGMAEAPAEAQAAGAS